MTALELLDVAARDPATLVASARAARERAWGRVITFSPKVFLPLTNLCPNFCDYCTFRRSPGQPGAWTMSSAEVRGWLDRGRRQGCSEALLCLGDAPERAFASYRENLAARGFGSTVDFLHFAATAALERGLLPHTNAGLLGRDEMARLRRVNVSLGLMLESASPRLCEPGGPHHRAPDKHPDKRLAMIEQAGELRIPFTTGILVGIGETRPERVESLLAIRRLHRRYGHVQEVIVQAFVPGPGARSPRAPPAVSDLVETVALARLILDPEVSVQVPPNLTPTAVELLLDAGANDLGGISPVTPDYVNRLHPWPHLADLRRRCAARGLTLRPRTAVADHLADAGGFLADPLVGPVERERRRLADEASVERLLGSRTATARAVSGAAP